MYIMYIYLRGHTRAPRASSTAPDRPTLTNGPGPEYTYICKRVSVCVCVFHYTTPSESLLYTHTHIYITHARTSLSAHRVGY